MRFGREDYDSRIIDKDNKIPQNEPVFFLRGKDMLAPALLLEWAKQLRLSGGDPNMASNAEDHAQLMIDWQREHGCRTPDLYESTDRKKWRDELKEELMNNKLNFNKVENLFEKIYGKSNKLYIFTSGDIKTKDKDKDFNSIDIECLRIDDNDRYNQCKLALFITKEGWKIIKNEI
jgi:hypothetical protein